MRILAERPSFTSITSVIEQANDELKDALAFKPTAALSQFLHNLQSNLKYYGIANRIVSNDARSLVESTLLSARIGYLLRIEERATKLDDDDCAHLFVLLDMLAVADHEAVTVLIGEFPAPFKKGHPATVLLCNALYVALGKHPNPKYVLNSARKANTTTFFLSMYRCVTAIYNKDEAIFVANLKYLLKSNRRQRFHSSMDNVICFEAHALANLWILHNGPIALGSLKLKLPWDQEFNELASIADLGAKDISGVSTVLDQWVRLIPNQINKDMLIETLKENWFRRLTRRARVNKRKEKLNKLLSQQP